MTEAAQHFPRPSRRILLLGIFHFKDAGLDAYKPQDSFDSLSPRRQHEIVEVVNCLARYAPTKIAVEQLPERQIILDERFAAYCRGDLAADPNEIVQVGFRLALRLGHRRVFAVDARDRHYDSDFDVEAYARQHGRELTTDASEPFFQLYEHEDRLLGQRTLREHLLYYNAEERILRAHGHYLVDWFTLGGNDEYVGPDWVTGWYNRNLRVFRNLQRITEHPDERILVIIGAGHVPILRHAVQASPEYELVEAAEYLGA